MEASPLSAKLCSPSAVEQQEEPLVTEPAQEESVPRLGPAITNLIRSVWRQRRLAAIGLVLGVALGWFGLPKLLGSDSTYEATIRLSIVQPTVDALSTSTPAFGAGAAAANDGTSGALLRDVTVAQTTLRKLGPQAKGLTTTLLLNGLSVTPVTGSPYVDLSFTSKSPSNAALVVRVYAETYAADRNTNAQQRLAAALASLQQQADKLRAQLGAGGGTANQAALQGRIDAFQKQIDDATTKQALLGDPTQVTGPPSVDLTGKPVSRKVAVALGVLLGLALGACAGLVLETTIPKVIKETDAEQASGLPFIAAVRRAGMRRSSLPVIDRPFTPAAEDYRRVGTALQRQGLGHDIKVLAITSADPREGKSSLAANLAHALTRQGRNVLLVSSDLRRPDVERLLGLQPRPGLAEALQDEAANVHGLLVSINEHLFVLPAGLPSRHPGELLASSRLGEVIAALRRMDAIVLLDTPPARWSADAIALAGVADATVIVARTGMTRWRNLQEATSGLRRDRVRQLGVVLVGTPGAIRPGLGRRYSAHSSLEPADPAVVVSPQGPQPAEPMRLAPLGNGPAAARRGGDSILGVSAGDPSRRDR
jgi:capsular exopolysaccharide synthesis family protein